MTDSSLLDAPPSGPLRVDRLRALAAHLRGGKLAHLFFNMNTYNDGSTGPDGCGTSGCAMGECPAVFPDAWHFERHGDSWSDAEHYLPRLREGSAGRTYLDGMEWFGIDIHEFRYLFGGPGGEVTEKMAARGLALHADGATAEQVGARVQDFADTPHLGRMVIVETDFSPFAPPCAGAVPAIVTSPFEGPVNAPVVPPAPAV